MLANSQQTIFINEILAGNENDEEDVFFQHEDWVEIYYAPGSNPAVLNLAGYYFTDDPTNLSKWEIPNTDAGATTLVTGQHHVFWIDKDPNQGADHVDFKLSLDGESFYLVAPDMLTIIDSITFPPMVNDISYGRECDGCDNWVFFNNTTHDSENMELTMPNELLFINEVMTNNVSNIHDEEDEFEQWLEIYNPNPYQVDLSDYTFTTNETDAPVSLVSDSDPTRTVVGAESFAVFWFDEDVLDGSNHMSFPLSNVSGNIRLLGPDGAEVDSYDYPILNIDQSRGRQSDGSSASINFTTPTPRVTNSLVIVQPANLYINEVMADNFTDTLDNYLELEDWVEIYNPNSFPVNLAGYYLSDNPNNPLKFQIAVDNPDSTTIAPNDWILFWADEDGDQGDHHLSFRLSNQGEELTLYSPDGFTIADQIEWGVEVDDISFGRSEDGAANWVHFIETTPDKSNNGAVMSVENNRHLIHEITMYPNPVLRGDRCYFEENTSVKVVNSLGQEMMNESNVHFIDTSELSPGMYLVHFEDFSMGRLIVE